jgi:hypothetical protein
VSINLNQLYGQQFANNIALLLQQRGSKLSDKVTVGYYQGKQASPVDQLGAVAAQRVTDRFAPMLRTDAPVDRRWVFPNDYDLDQLIDRFDKLRMLTDPTSAYVQNGVSGMNRAKDDEIIAAFFGTAKTGEAGATSTTFPSSQVVGVNTGGTGSTLSVAKLREARRILLANEVDLDMDPIYAAISSRDSDALLNEVQVTSSDFNGDKPVLTEGKVTRFLGINFVYVERPAMTATATDDQSGTSRQVPVWAKSGMHLGIWNDTTTDVSQRNDLRGLPYQAYVYGTFGATRLEEKKIVKIWAR